MTAARAAGWTKGLADMSRPFSLGDDLSAVREVVEIIPPSRVRVGCEVVLEATGVDPHVCGLPSRGYGIRLRVFLDVGDCLRLRVAPRRSTQAGDVAVLVFFVLLVTCWVMANSFVAEVAGTTSTWTVAGTAGTSLA